MSPTTSTVMSLGSMPGSSTRIVRFPSSTNDSIGGFRAADLICRRKGTVLYGAASPASIARMGLEVIETPVRSPKANSPCERLVGTLRRECLDWIIPLTEEHLRKTLRSWLSITIEADHTLLWGQAFLIPLNFPVPSNARGIVSTDQAESWRTPS